MTVVRVLNKFLLRITEIIPLTFWFLWERAGYLSHSSLERFIRFQSEPRALPAGQLYGFRLSRPHSRMHPR